MPLYVLLPIVVVGIAGITIILHLLGQSRLITLANDAAAQGAWDREIDIDPARTVIRSHDGHAALIITASGRHGIVFPMGADTTARYLDGATFRPLGTGLRVILPDFTAPHIDLILDPDEAANWPEMMRQPA